MYVTTPEIKKYVEDYDFIFSSGLTIGYTIDKAAGDTIEFDADIITIRITPKASPNNPEFIVPGELVTIYVSNLSIYKQTSREVVELAPEQKFEQVTTGKLVH